MRILHLVGRSQRRGAELVALDLADALDEVGEENLVLACAPGFDGGCDPALPALTRRIAMDPPALVRAAWRLRRHLRTLQPDAVLAHGGWAVQVATLASPRGGPAIVWQRILGFTDGMTRGPRGSWWRIVVRRVDAAVALAPDMEHELRSLGFTGPVWTISNFRRPDRFVGVDRATAGAQLREQLALAPGTPVIGLVGHLIEQKRPERALEVLTHVRASGVDAHLVVAGTGPLEPEFVADARRRTLTAAVHLLGNRDDVETVLGALDLLLLTSDAEGIPGIVIEAQMTGCPVVTFPVGAVDAVVKDGETGVVLARSDTHLMADAVVKLLQEPEVRHALGAEGRRRAGQFSTGRAAREYATRLEALRHARA